MPFTQNAPCEPGCSAFGAILITLPSWMVRNEPHSALHSQHVLGTISVGDRFDGRTFIATSFGGHQGYPRPSRTQGASGGGSACSSIRADFIPQILLQIAARRLG